jgi:hypothetical protein
MEQTKSQLLEQKHLLNEIDSYIYAMFLPKEDVDELLSIYKQKECDLENLLNNLEAHGRSKKKLFFNYVSFREKIREKEREYFKKIFAVQIE